MPEQYLLLRDDLPKNGALSVIFKNDWIMPVCPKQTFLVDYIRHTLELLYEPADTARGVNDNAGQVESEFDETLREDNFTPDEIGQVKCFFSQQLCICLSDILGENIIKLGQFLAGNNGQREQETSRILIRKKIIDGQIKIVAEAEYSNIRCYALAENGELEEEAHRIPGSVKAIYTLESGGFKLLHIEASNSYVSKLITGEVLPNDSTNDLAVSAAEEEFNNSMSELWQLEKNLSSHALKILIQPEVKTIRRGLIRQSGYLDKRDNKKYVENMSKLSMVANSVIEAVATPKRIPTRKRLVAISNEKIFESNSTQSSKLKWALIGIAAVLVLGVCLVASVASFGVLAAPSVFAGFLAAGVALQASGIVFGATAATTTTISAAKLSQTSEQQTRARLKASLQAIGQNFCLFSSGMRVKEDRKNSSDEATLSCQLLLNIY